MSKKNISLREDIGNIRKLERSLSRELERDDIRNIETENRMEMRYNALKRYGIIGDMKLYGCLTAVMATGSSLSFYTASHVPNYSQVAERFPDIPYISPAEVGLVCGLFTSIVSIYFGFKFVDDVGRCIEMKYLQRRLRREKKI